MRFVKCDVVEWKEFQNLVTAFEEQFDDVPDVCIAEASVFEILPKQEDIAEAVINL